MLRSALKALYRRWRIRSLKTKAILPSALLILFSLVASTTIFVGGSHLTRRWLLEGHISTQADDVNQTLNQRAEAVSNAVQVLVSDLDLVYALQEGTDAAQSTLNNRIRVVQERFDLALVQIYDQHGLVQAGLIPSSVCLDASATSSLLNMAESGRSVARVVDGRLLLLGRAPLLEEAGTVLVGIDLESELERMRARDGLSADLGLTLRGTHIGTDGGLPFDAQDGWVSDRYCQSRSIMLGATPAELLLVHPSRDMKQVTHIALLVMAGTTFLATLLLIGINVMVICSVARPIRVLSATAQAVGQGDLEQEVQLLPNSLMIGEGDELGLLVKAFNEMTGDLRKQHADLESKVKARTAGLSIAADVARAVSSSLELNVILRESAQIIKRRLGHVCPGVYHVGIFLTEEDSAIVVLREAASEARDMLAGRGMRIPVGSKSPVGLAVATEQLKAIQNVKMTSTHLKPPLLIDTYSAVAVPLQVGDMLIGALDVQSEQPDAFPSDTHQLLIMLANQIATAVHNARLYHQQRQAAEHLAEVDQLKTQFLAMISHKLRAPLTTIAGLSGSLLEKSTGSLTDQQEQDVSLIHSLGQHLLELTDDFLDISKMRSGTITLNLEDVNMRLLIESALDAVAPLIEDKPITLCAEIDSDLPVVCADKRRVRQVMLNLLSNAVAFTESGRIDVRVRVIEALNVDRGRMESFMEVRISDTGLGISREKLTGGFRVFNRPSGSPVSECVAAGFGLPITETLIDLHGGRIWVDSDPAEGTTFTFVLPIDQLSVRKNHLPERVRADSTEVTSHHVV